MYIFQQKGPPMDKTRARAIKVVESYLAEIEWVKHVSINSNSDNDTAVDNCNGAYDVTTVSTLTWY